MHRLSRCCCCSVRTGAQVVAGLSLALGVIMLGAYSFGLAIDAPFLVASHYRGMAFRDNESKLITDDVYRTLMVKLDMLEFVMRTLLTFGVVEKVIHIIFTILLLVGILKNKHKLMMPWLILASLGLVLNVAMVVGIPIYSLVQGNLCNAATYLLVGTPMILLLFYLVRVVDSEYKNIKDANDKSDNLLVGPKSVPKVAISPLFVLS